MRFTLLLVFFLSPAFASAQTTEQVSAILELPVQSPETVEFQLRQYLMKRVPPLPTPRSAREWETESRKLREQVLALDLIFTGNAAPERPLRPEGSQANDRALNQLLEESKNKSMAAWMVSRPPSALYGQLLAPLGERPLGIKAAQLVAAALRPEIFSQVRIRQGMDSMSHLYAVPVTYQQAPGLFCRDLYKEFDLDQLEVLARPTEVLQE